MKKLTFALLILIGIGLFGQNKIYIWKNNVIADSMSITSDLKISFKTASKDSSAVIKDTTIAIEDTLTTSTDSVTIPSTKLVAYYPFNNSAADESGYGNDGTLLGAVPCTDRFNNLNRAMYFGGSGKRIEVQDSPELALTSVFTISVWVYQLSAETGGYRILDKATPGLAVGDGWLFDTYNDEHTGNTARISGFSGAPGYGYGYEHTPFSLFAWHHLAVVYKSNYAYFYLDGVPDGILYLPGPLPINNLKMAVGAPLNGYYQSLSFLGYLDDIRIYKRSLSAAEIKALFHESGWSGN